MATIKSEKIENGITIITTNEIYSCDDARLSDIGVHFHEGKRFICAYMGYTGHWYAYNPETGKEIATFTREFYENFIASSRRGKLERSNNNKA